MAGAFTGHDRLGKAEKSFQTSAEPVASEAIISKYKAKVGLAVFMVLFICKFRLTGNMVG